ncbi:MAG: RlpA-like double-psi beta-barrel domain-containing protein [Candidatus Moranbacteria bacterium]|nr:RlpA-like double-psi beta-barrel domain-containing protein [Candidatus Moranbacteria bacterium]
MLIITGVWFLRDDISQMSFWHVNETWMPEGYSKAVRVTLDDDGRVFDVMTKSTNIKDFLDEQKIVLGDEDVVFGPLENRVYAHATIGIHRAKHITLAVGGEKRALVTYQTSVERMLLENDVILGEDDFVLPKNEDVVIDKASVSVVRVIVKEEIIDKTIAFAITIEEDEKLSWRKAIVTQKGEAGIKRSTYRVVSYDGKEIDRTIMKQEIVKEPVTEKTMQGTYVAVKGTAHTGLGTWYAYTGTLAAASPWLPMGSYAKVTNQENGKTVIVKINDRGPFGKNRIIDLDKVAFAKIASIGAGVISLKVEEVAN